MSVMNEEKRVQLQSLQKHPGWKHIMDYILSTQAMKFNEAAKAGTSSEDICKALGAVEALKRLANWAEVSSLQQDQ